MMNTAISTTFLGVQDLMIDEDALNAHVLQPCDAMELVVFANSPIGVSTGGTAFRNLVTKLYMAHLTSSLTAAVE
jgi:hypothetical protein